MTSRSRGSRGVTSRGQTLPDFVVGIAIFLVTVTLIVQFVPQLFLPYEDPERSVVVQRVATDLEQGLLAAEGSPSTLNETCTLAFFNGTDVAGCPFDASDPVTDRVGVSSAYDVNVALRDAPSDAPGSQLLCEDNGSVTGCGSGGDVLVVGSPAPGDGESVALARQRVVVGDDAGVIEVRVW